MIRQRLTSPRWGWFRNPGCLSYQRAFVSHLSTTRTGIFTCCMTRVQKRSAFQRRPVDTQRSQEAVRCGATTGTPEAMNRLHVHRLWSAHHRHHHQPPLATAVISTVKFQSSPFPPFHYEAQSMRLLERGISRTWLGHLNCAVCGVGGSSGHGAFGKPKLPRTLKRLNLPKEKLKMGFLTLLCFQAALRRRRRSRGRCLGCLGQRLCGAGARNA